MLAADAVIASPSPAFYVPLAVAKTGAGAYALVARIRPGTDVGALRRSETVASRCWENASIVPLVVIGVHDGVIFLVLRLILAVTGVGRSSKYCNLALGASIDMGTANSGSTMLYHRVEKGKEGSAEVVK